MQEIHAMGLSVFARIYLPAGEDYYYRNVQLLT